MLLIYLQMLDTPDEKHKFELIYLEYRDHMFKKANSILHNEFDAEDAVHKAFMSIAKNLDKIDEPISNSTKGFVLTIVENKAIDMTRSASNRYNVPLDETFIDDATMQQALDYCENDAISQCILKLPATYREVIMLKYVNGYSLKEIAEILEITPANAIKIDQRAKKKLETICKEAGIL